MMILEQLCNINGVSGNEQKVSAFIIEQISPYCTSLEKDNKGNVIAFKKGRLTTKNKVMLSAHMDEVGFIVKDIDDFGYIKFETVGGIDSKILPSKRVFIGEKQIEGVIGMMSVHFQSEDERRKTVEIEKLYIDIGAASKEQAMECVSKGDYIYFSTKYEAFSDNVVKAKALDDRVGCYVLMELIKKDIDYDFYATFNVMEEIGLQGAKVTSDIIRPDIAIVIEGTTCSDVLGTNPYEVSTTFGGGVAISVGDRGSISDVKLNNLIINIAKENEIKYQLKRTTLGGNDAGEIQCSGFGVRTAVLSVPVRYIHSPISLMNKNDLKAMIDLMSKLLNEEALYDRATKTAFTN